MSSCDSWRQQRRYLIYEQPTNVYVRLAPRPTKIPNQKSLEKYVESTVSKIAADADERHDLNRAKLQSKFSFYFPQPANDITQQNSISMKFLFSLYLWLDCI